MELQLSATWILEIVACVLSVGCLGAMAGVLNYADGHLVLNWHGLTLNTIISILGTASKLCAMFVLGAAIAQSKWAIFSHSPRSLLEFEAVEQAGRGAFGAAKLLFTTRKVATVGAIAILLSLAFDPFAQQIVQLDQEVSFSTSSDVTLPRAQRFSAGSRIPVASIMSDYNNLTRGSGVIGVHVDADFAVQSAALYGISRSLANVTQQLPVNCPSGNCTWAESESLAVCSVCNDISSQLLQEAVAGTSPTLMSLDVSNPPPFNGNLTRESLPNGLYLDEADGGPALVNMISYGTGNRARTVSMSTIDTLIWSMTMMRLSPEQRKSNWPLESPPEAIECALYYCVKQYAVTVANGTVLQSSRVNDAAKRDPASWIPRVEGESDLTFAEGDETSLEFDSELSRIQRSDLMLGNGYNVSQRAVDPISSWFQNTMADRNTTESMPEANGYMTASYGEPGSEYFKPGQYKPSVMQPLFDSPNLAATFETLAESMSNAIRAGGDNKVMQTGELGRPVTKYRISWPWITLPILVVLFALIQLLMTMWTSRDTPLWKSSTLATLSRGAYIGNVLEQASTVQEMHAAAGSRPVDLFSRTEPEGLAAVANAEAKQGQVSVVEIGEQIARTMPLYSTRPISIDVPLYGASRRSG